MHQFKQKEGNGQVFQDDEWWQFCFMAALTGMAANPDMHNLEINRRASLIADAAVEERHKRLPKE